MKLTCIEAVTRVKTIDVPDEYMGMDNDDLESCPEILELMWDNIELNGWDEEYCHESTITIGAHEPTLYRSQF